MSTEQNGVTAEIWLWTGDLAFFFFFLFFPVWPGKSVLISETYTSMETEEPSIGFRKMLMYVNTYATQEGQTLCTLHPHKWREGVEAHLYSIHSCKRDPLQEVLRGDPFQELARQVRQLEWNALSQSARWSIIKKGEPDLGHCPPHAHTQVCSFDYLHTFEHTNIYMRVKMDF